MMRLIPFSLLALLALNYPALLFAEDGPLLNTLQKVFPEVKADRVDVWVQRGVTRSEKSSYVYSMWDLMRTPEASSLTEDDVVVATLLIACGGKGIQPFPLAKVDIVRIKEQDSYGKPRWDSLERISHGEVEASACERLTNQEVTLSKEEIKNSIKAFRYSR